MSRKFLMNEIEFGHVVEFEIRNEARPQPQNNVLASVPTGHGECRLRLAISDVEMRFQLSDKVGHDVDWEVRAENASSSFPRGSGTLVEYSPSTGKVVIVW